MKPLSEKLEELSENVAAHGCEVCGECHVEETFTKELQAWLREAEIWVANNRYQAVVLLGENEVSNLGGQLITEDVLSKLLGTTQEGK